ncbi:MAG: sugar ABC transporter substrate-binding protein [Acidimicrobiales bacterium]
MNTQGEGFEDRRYGRREVLGAGIAVGAGLFATKGMSRRLTESRTSTTHLAASGSWKYAVIPPVVNPFYLPFPGAIKAAEAKFGTGPIAYEFPSAFTQDAENIVVDGLAAKGYNLMAIQPADPVAGDATIKRLVADGIKVVCFGAPPAQPSEAVFALATDVENAAYFAAVQTIKIIGGQGNIVHFTGDVSDSNTAPRIKGVNKAVAATHGRVKLLETITNDDSPSSATTAVADVFAAHGIAINGIVCTAYNPAAAVAEQLQKANNHTIKCVGIDTATDTIDAIKTGFLAGTVIQNPYGMCYLSIYSLKLLSEGYTWKKSSPFFIDSGTAFVDKSNVAHWQSLQAQLTSTLEASWLNYFKKP